MDGFQPTPAHPAKTSRGLLPALLAGLQAGMVGVLWMLAWMGVSSAWEGRSFWTPENLFATAFYGGSAYGSGFERSTFSGLALYLLLYSLLGAIFAAVVRDRLPRVRALLGAVLLGVIWYFLSFRVLWKTFIPLAYLLHSEHSTFLGHLIYGTFLGRFQVYLEPPRAATPPTSAAAPDEVKGSDQAGFETTPAPTQSSSPPDPV